MSRRSGLKPEGGPLSKTLARFKAENSLSEQSMQKAIGIGQAILNRLRHDESPTIPMLRRLAKFFSWSTVEFGEALLYEGYRGRKKP